MEFLSILFVLVFLYGVYCLIRDVKKLILKFFKHRTSQVNSKKSGGENIEDLY